MKYPKITPQAIRDIRERLGLTQVEAGELIGGGPRAFTKYEAGTVKPAAAVVRLLRLLDADPSMMSILQGCSFRPAAASTPSPFQVTARDIECQTEQTFPELLRRLLDAEAEANGLPKCDIKVPSSIHTKDGGEDGWITWQGGADHTTFLPSRHSQFQLKAGKVSPARAGKDVLTKKGDVKDMVRSALEDGGHYIMLCAYPYVRQGINTRADRIREKLRGAGLTIDNRQIEFRGADQIARWVNRYPAVAMWVKEQTQPGTIGPFRSWNHWAGRPEHDGSPWVEDERLSFVRDHLLRQQATNPRKAARVVGLSGVGKSRLVLEALGRTGQDEATGLFLADFVMYTTQSEASFEAISGVVQNLAGSGRRAVVVVDNCDSEAHRILAGMVLRRESRLSLITIGNEISSGTLDENTLKIAEASSFVIESIIDRIALGLPSVDRHRLVRFSKGFPTIAILMGRTWGTTQPLAHITEANLVDAFILGRRPQDHELLKSAMLLAVFGLVGVESANDRQLDEVAGFGRHLTADDLYADLGRLIEMGVAKRRGQFAILQPRPIALHLAERQWKEWRAAKWDEVLSGDIDPALKVSAAQQLAPLNTTGISRKVVNHVCQVGGPFDSLDKIHAAGHAEVLPFLAEVNPKTVVDLIERLLNEAGHSSQIILGDVRGHLIRALGRIAFHSCTFEDGARLLLRLAATDGAMRGHDASSRFKALFPMFLGNTTAGGNARLLMLEKAAHTNIPGQPALVVEALIAGCEMDHFSRVVDAEVQGSRPALDSWQPATNREAAAYIKGCVARLAGFALGNDESGTRARSSLGLEVLRPLVRHGFIDTVETVVRQVTASVGYWPEALRGLKVVLVDDVKNMDDKIVGRVRSLVAQLEPVSLESRVRSLVIEPPMPELGNEGLGWEARYEHDTKEVEKLAPELLRQPSTLAALLPQLSRGHPRLADKLGMAIATSTDPLAWLEPMVDAIAETPEHERNFDLLSGFVTGLARNHPDVVAAFKQRATQASELGPVFPQICARLGITSSDIQLAIEALRNGSLPPSRLNWWAQGGVLAKAPAALVAPLFDAMLDGSVEAFVQAIELMGMYAFGALNRLKGLLPQILKLAENATRRETVASQRPRSNGTYPYHFEQIMDYMLNRGRKDAGARATALALAKALAKVERFDDGLLVNSVLPKLLSSFPVISWPLIGQAIVSDERRAASLRYVLGDPFSFGRESNPPILALPEDTLFAWCHAHPDRAPAFVARTVPILASPQGQTPGPSLHPTMARLLDEFGEREDVLEAVAVNIRSFSWVGSPIKTLALHKEILVKMREHPKPELRRWVNNMLHEIDDDIEKASSRDQEREAQREIQPNIG